MYSTSCDCAYTHLAVMWTTRLMGPLDLGTALMSSNWRETLPDMLIECVGWVWGW